MKNPSIKRSVVWRSLLACLLAASVLPAFAQTVTISPYTYNYWAGINTSKLLAPGNYVVATTGGSPSVNLSASGPSGITATLVPALCTSTSTNMMMTLACTNVAAGAYSLTISGSGTASYSTNANLFVVPMWSQTNSGFSGTWATAGNWSSGALLNGGGSDSVYFEKLIAAPWTNVVDASQSIQDFILLSDADDVPPANPLDTVINSGQTLSVLGTNGLFLGRKVGGGQKPFIKFEGGGTLLVSNPAAAFAVVDSCVNGTRFFTVNMTNLNTLKATVSRVGIGDASLSSICGAVSNGIKNDVLGAQQVGFWFAKTNVIVASFVDNYNAVDFNTAVQFGRESGANTITASAMYYNLGQSNVIFADSVGVGRGGSTGNVPLRFAPVFTNETAPIANAYFRSTNGGRMSLLAVAVDSGTVAAFAKNLGTADFRGGIVDMLVDQIWVGQNRTNSSGQTVTGTLNFDWGTIDANTVILGNMKYTNTTAITGNLVVGTNGTFKVNSNLVLGQTPDPTNAVGFETYAATVSGQVTINNGGTLRANQITVGALSSNNVVTVNVGGSLIVSNTIAGINKGLTTLSLDGAQLTFSVLAGITNAYVTNLNTTTTASKININSAPAGQSTNVLIVYQAANQTPNISIGTLPPGFNNMQIAVDTVAKTVSLIISTNQPKNLVWRGGANAQWDHTSLNWQDTNTLAITKFTDGDQAIFDDKVGVPTTISIVDAVNPGQSGNGIVVNNTTNQFTFADGGGSIGSGTLAKTGTNSLEIDCTSSIGAQLNGGILNVYSIGSIANATTLAGTTLNVGSTGAVGGGVTCAGTLQNNGVIFGSLTLQTGASASSAGILSNSVSMQPSTSLNNSGTMTAIGSLTVATNSTLVNGGTIYGSTLTVNAGGTLIDTVPGSAANSSGSINVATLLVNGTFYPGGNGLAIATTKVTDYDYSSGSGVGNPNGRVQLSAGSLIVMKVNSTNVQPNTKIFSLSQVFGPSGAAKAINGCTLLISNIGPTAFSVGNAFKLFGNYINDTVIGNAGLNTTNCYPIIIPTVPGPGLAWDMTQLYASGTIGVIAASSVQITLTNTVTLISGTNQIVTELSWPVDFIGSGWLQQQNSTLTNGLGTNWNNVGASDYVNDIFLTNTITPGSSVFYRFVRP